MVLVIVLIAMEGDFGTIVPVLAIYAFAGYRLMPSLLVVFAGVAKARFFTHVEDSLYGYLTETPTSDRLPFEHSLSIDGLLFLHPGSSRHGLPEIELTIERNTTVGLVGPTGCGKTTLVDIILGLLEPTDGRLLADDMSLTGGLMP